MSERPLPPAMPDYVCRAPTLCFDEHSLACRIEAVVLVLLGLFAGSLLIMLALLLLSALVKAA